jgi:hypothetical protein
MPPIATEVLHLEGEVLPQSDHPEAGIVVEARDFGTGQVLARASLASQFERFAMDVQGDAVRASPATPQGDIVVVVAGYDLDGDDQLGAADPLFGVDTERVLAYVRGPEDVNATAPGAGPGWNRVFRADGPVRLVPMSGQVLGNGLTDLVVIPNLVPEEREPAFEIRVPRRRGAWCVGIEVPTVSGGRIEGSALLVGAPADRRGRARLVLPPEPVSAGVPFIEADTTYGRFVRWPATDPACTSFDAAADGVTTWALPSVTYVRTTSVAGALVGWLQNGVGPNDWFFVGEPIGPVLVHDLVLGDPEG